MTPAKPRRRPRSHGRHTLVSPAPRAPPPAAPEGPLLILRPPPPRGPPSSLAARRASADGVGATVSPRCGRAVVSPRGGPVRMGCDVARGEARHAPGAERGLGRGGSVVRAGDLAGWVLAGSRPRRGKNKRFLIKVGAASGTALCYIWLPLVSFFSILYSEFDFWSFSALRHKRLRAEPRPAPPRRAPPARFSRDENNAHRVRRNTSELNPAPYGQGGA